MSILKDFGTAQVPANRIAAEPIKVQPRQLFFGIIQPL